jgi:1-acyl-sn-glycerol-3-phosphate acyltransferase
MTLMAKNTWPDVPATMPTRGWGWGKVMGRTMLSRAGWGFEGEIPSISKGVIIVAPHTSNWDFVVGAAGMLALDLDIRFLGKHTLFQGPLAPLMRGLGGIPVDRSQVGGGVVEDMAALFEQEEQLLLALAPEGTRSSVERWKTGFHRIALAASVPVVAVALDYVNKKIRFGPCMKVTDDLEHDLEVFQHFFSDAGGKRGNPEGPSA